MPFLQAGMFQQRSPGREALIRWAHWTRKVTPITAVMSFQIVLVS